MTINRAIQAVLAVHEDQIAFHQFYVVLCNYLYRRQTFFNEYLFLFVVRALAVSGSLPCPLSFKYASCISLSTLYGHTYSKNMDQPGKVANPARGQLNRENQYFLVRVRA